MHLHHRLLSIGHSHRRAVLVMYFWAALLSFGAVALSITGGPAELLVAIAVLLVVGVVVVLGPRARRAAREARAAELAAQRERSRADHPTARAVRSRTARRRRAGRPPTARPPRREVAPMTAARRPRAAVQRCPLGPVVPARRAPGHRRGHGGRRRPSPGCSAAGGCAGRAGRRGVVAAFFVVSGVVIAWAGRIDDTLHAARRRWDPSW